MFFGVFVQRRGIEPSTDSSENSPRTFLEKYRGCDIRLPRTLPPALRAVDDITSLEKYGGRFYRSRCVCTCHCARARKRKTRRRGSPTRRDCLLALYNKHRELLPRSSSLHHAGRPRPRKGGGRRIKDRFFTRFSALRATPAQELIFLQRFIDTATPTSPFAFS